MGPQGQGDMSNFLNQKDAQVVAVCDVKTDQLEQARAVVNRRYQNKDCATYGKLAMTAGAVRAKISMPA